jgi:hypothetical protein
LDVFDTLGGKCGFGFIGAPLVALRLCKLDVEGMTHFFRARKLLNFLEAFCTSNFQLQTLDMDHGFCRVDRDLLHHPALFALYGSAGWMARTPCFCPVWVLSPSPDFVTRRLRDGQGSEVGRSWFEKKFAWFILFSDLSNFKIRAYDKLNVSESETLQQAILLQSTVLDAFLGSYGSYSSLDLSCNLPFQSGNPQHPHH